MTTKGYDVFKDGADSVLKERTTDHDSTRNKQA
jgi:hypothetical protein